MRLTKLLLPALIVAAPAQPLLAAHDEPGRVANVRGEALLQSEDGEWGYLDRNLPVIPGDLYWTAPGALLELELPGGVVLRAGPEARFEIRELHTIPEILHAAGPLFVCSRSSNPFVTARILTSTARIELQRSGAVRVDVNAEGGTRVTAKDGLVDFEAGGELGLLARQERIYVDPGLLPSQVVYVSDEDDFDLWNRDACNGVSFDSLDLVGMGSLNEMGTWRRVNGLRVWTPDAPAGWSPYRDGRWDWAPGYGWIWVDDQPWGWTTHHYGSWAWIDGYGWTWYPGSDWHAGNVIWWRAGDSILWAPRDPWGYPVRVGGGITIRIGDYSVPRSILCRGRAVDARDGTIRPHRQHTPHIGPVSPLPSQVAKADPPPARRRGARAEDEVTGRAGDRAQVIARRASMVEDDPARSGSFVVRLPREAVPDRRAQLRAAATQPAPDATPRSSPASPRNAWREAPVFLPEVGSAAPTLGEGGSGAMTAGRRSPTTQRPEAGGSDGRITLPPAGGSGSATGPSPSTIELPRRTRARSGSPVIDRRKTPQPEPTPNIIRTPRQVPTPAIRRPQPKPETPETETTESDSQTQERRRRR